MQLPRTLGSAAEAVAGARDDPARLRALFYASAVPMVMVDDERRYVHVNAPALLAFRASFAELREHRIDDLTPPYLVSTLHRLWSQLLETGYVTGRYDVANPDGTRLRVVFYALAGVLPGSTRPPAPPLADLYEAARSAFPGVKLGGGMFTFFTELNRKRPPAELLDFVHNVTCPNVHAADDRSVMETHEALPWWGFALFGGVVSV